MTQQTELSAVELATAITIAWLTGQDKQVAAVEVPTFLRSVHSALVELASGSDGSEDYETDEFTPAVSVRKSLASKDYIISMIDGKPYKTLRRHLTRHGLTPEEYRARYNLKPDYPMVSESYSAKRSEMAKEIGLGQKGRAARSAARAKADGRART